MKFLLLVDRDNTRTIVNSDFITQVFVTEDDETMAGIHLSDRQEPVCVKESVEQIWDLLRRDDKVAVYCPSPDELYPALQVPGYDDGSPLGMETTFGTEGDRLKRAKEPHNWTGLRQWGLVPRSDRQCTICDVPFFMHPILPVAPEHTELKD